MSVEDKFKESKIGVLYFKCKPEETYNERWELLRSIEDINQENVGDKLLKNAVTYVDPEAINFLLEAGVDPSSIVGEFNGYTLLHDLANHKEKTKFKVPEGKVYDSTKLLLKAGLSPFKKENNLQYLAIQVAAKNGIHEMIQAFIDENKKIDFVTDAGYTLLHIACLYANKSAKPQVAGLMASQRLVDDPDNKEDVYKTIKLLLSTDFDPDEKDNNGKAPKDFAGECEDERIPALLNGIDVENISEDDKDTLLQVKAKGLTIVQAIILEDIEALEALLQLGNNPNEPTDSTASAIRNNNGTYIHVKDETPLGAACSILNADAISLLFAYGANANERDSVGRTALTYILTKGPNSNTTWDEGLKKNLFDKTMKEFEKAEFAINDSADNVGNTLFNLACEYVQEAHNGIPELLINRLLKLKADPNIPNNKGVSPLMHICNCSKSSVIEDIQVKLLEAGADVAAKDDNGNTPLIYATSNDNKSLGRSMADMLFTFGDPDVNAVNNAQKTALEIATEKNNEPLVNYLLKKL